MTRARVIRIERHPLGARLHLLGHRLHEWHLGAGILGCLAIHAALGNPQLTFATLVAAIAGAWLVAKDWPDLLGSHRDATAWRLGLHRRPHPLRTLRRADPLPTLAAVGAIAVAVVNLVSALTPNVAWRGHALLALEPMAAMRVSHALAIPAASTLLVTGLYLGRRRRRALHLAIALLVALAVLNILKGLDVEEATADVVAAVLLWLGRSSFYVEHEPLSRRGAGRQIAALMVGAAAIAGASVWVAAGSGASLGAVASTTADLLLWQHAPLAFHDEFGQLGLALGILSGATLLGCASLVFRPLAGPRAFPDAIARATAGRLVRAHGSDTLAYFKLRRDEHYLFARDGRAFLGYRVVNGVLLVSGDPVGPPATIPALLRELGDFAERRGLTVAALGVSAQLRPLFAQMGLKALYIGDEAVVHTAEFSLEGRAIRKVRQSVSRLEKSGYTVEVCPLSELDEATLHELESVSAEWREGAPERGFSMALDELRRDEHGDTTIAVALDETGRPRGFLQFVPSFGRPAASLAFMRRGNGTPNGLTEFLVVRSIEALRERGVAEISLNFAAFARILDQPRNAAERCAGRLLSVADRYFQIESLYRFNAKFFPRWEPRYFLYDGVHRFPRAALAALRAEGQLPTVSLPRRSRPAPMSVGYAAGS
ncbi:MAG TPA: phosphatidylglycerol lysyltransferase domain-containing protein [Gaiellaceae bacterium]|nr:phosphatidylglycerol lysyltransferase domain-containing protein [Gaiellaceae bacterium]